MQLPIPKIIQSNGVRYYAIINNIQITSNRSVVKTKVKKPQQFPILLEESYGLGNHIYG